MNIKLPLAYLGLLGGIVLIIFDYFTSVEGFKSFQRNATPHWIMATAPYALAAICLAFNGLAAYILVMIKDEDKSNARMVGLVISFVITWLWDWGTSLVGFVTLMTGTESFGEAMSKGSKSEIFVAVSTAVLVAMGPFITTLFGDYIKNQGGFNGFLNGMLNFATEKKGR